MALERFVSVLSYIAPVGVLGTPTNRTASSSLRPPFLRVSVLKDQWLSIDSTQESK